MKISWIRFYFILMFFVSQNRPKWHKVNLSTVSGLESKMISNAYKIGSFEEE